MGPFAMPIRAYRVAVGSPPTCRLVRPLLEGHGWVGGADSEIDTGLCSAPEGGQSLLPAREWSVSTETSGTGIRLACPLALVVGNLGHSILGGWAGSSGTSVPL